MRAAPRPEPVRARSEVGFKDRLQHHLGGGLSHAVPHRRDAQRSLFAICFRDPHPPHRVRSVAARPQVGRQLGQESFGPVLLNLLDGLLIHAGCPSVGFDLAPRSGQDVLAVHLVVERMEPPRSTRLRGPIQGALELLHLVVGGPSPMGTHQRLPPARPQTKYGAFPPPCFCYHGLVGTVRRSDSRSALTHFAV